MFTRKAQSALEYLIILAVIVGAVVAFATTTLKDRVTTILTNVTDDMSGTVDALDFGGDDAPEGEE